MAAAHAGQLLEPRACRVLSAGAVAAVVALIALGCSARSDSGAEDVELTLRAQAVEGRPVSDVELERSKAIIEERLDQADIDATVAKADDSLVIELDRDQAAAADRVVELATTTGLLEIYDLEKNLVGPSIDAGGLPVALESRSALGAPPKTVVLECGIDEEACPGVVGESRRAKVHYLLRYDPPSVPELDGGDVQLEGVRQDFDTTTGDPTVVMQFTDDGAAEFGELTDTLADRGRARFSSLGADGDPAATYQHFAIVLDREIKSWPSIDWESYPNGIAGENGVQIAGMGDLQEAKDLALVLRTGALPVHFKVVPPAASGG